MGFRSGRRGYAIVLLSLSSLYLCAILLPLLYSVVFPNQDLQRFVFALEERATPSPDSETVVRQAIEGVGPLRRAIKVAYYSQVSAKFHYGASGRTERIRVSQATYVAWFEKHPPAVLVAMTCYEYGEGQKTYRITEASSASLVRGYALPVGLFGLSLFLARRRKPAAAPAA